MDISNEAGLSEADVAAALKQYGPNTLPEKKKNWFTRLWGWVASPITVMLLLAAGLSWYAGKHADAWIILALFVVNITISIWHEWKTDDSIAKLQKRLELSVRTKRSGKWEWIPSTQLVPGDIITLSIGAVVPADATILKAENLSINESVLTGESLPKEKKVDETAYSGSFVATGSGVARVTATGGNTNFGKTVGLVERTKRRSALETDILTISTGISIASIVVVVLLSGAFMFWLHAPWIDLVTLDLSLLIAGIPVALPTVMSLIVSVGVVQLAKKHVIVRRLSSLEDLANVDLLLSDKTGTLSENKLHIEQVILFNAASDEEVIQEALDAAFDTERDDYGVAVAAKAKELGITQHAQIEVLPGDSERKRGTGIIQGESGEYVVSYGSPHTIQSLCDMDAKETESFGQHLTEAAQQGFRVMAVAINRAGRDEAHMSLSGLMLISDRLHPDAPAAIAFMREHGIGVKMVTGDNFEVSRRAASELALEGTIYRRDVLDQGKEAIASVLPDAAGFAEVLPKDKFAIVQAARLGHIVAVTGDGINDLPAVHEADVGFAVANAVDALKTTADIVLLENGVSRIRDAIIEARQIFFRLGNYALYRISESFRVIITIAVLGILYRTYPLVPVQLIVLAFLNDVPIITLAFDRVKQAAKPQHVDIIGRFALGGMFGLAGIGNSLIMFFIMFSMLHLPWGQIETLFFLKLVVSGHMLIYVAHTSERWWKFLPSWQVIAATLTTQAVATAFAYFGIFTDPVPLSLIALIWAWSFLWMQISEGMKPLRLAIMGRAHPAH
ncbi:MAG TPA: plasma-membrane proton-efflux P-type ATPase [Candidatus Paceibacterota bacterium]|nr:plasma-membrane proton-efflux P-type ATPase [Candidatus Paceibacterota bacterium]